MERIWFKSYDEGVRHEIDTPRFQSLRDMMEASFEEFADRPSFTNMGTTLTFAELDRLSRQFACYLQNDLGIEKGDRVAIMLPNVLQYAVALCGIHRAGAVCVNVNPLYTARELKHQLADSGSRVILILENFASTLEEVIDDTEVGHVIVTGVGDLLKWPKGVIVNTVLKYVKKAVPSYHFKYMTRFREALRKGEGETLKHVEIGLDDLAFLQYTGGTTGVSKGAMLSHGNLCFNIDQSVEWQADALEDIEQAVAITALPLYHIFSLQGNCLVGIAQGSLNVLITNPRDFKAFVKEISDYRFNLFNSVNTLFAALLNTPGFSELDFSGLRVVVGGGMAVQPAVAEDWKHVTGASIVQGYGLTETSPACICNKPGAEFSGAIGLPIPSTDVIIAGDDGNALAVGEIGEICIKGPQVMQGYWQRPAETSNVMLPGGWLRTGDIGRMDENGYVFIEDRKKDMILVSGFNVYPNEIENVVVELDGILEAAAIGIPDERSTEAVKVFAVRTDPNVTEDDVIAYCKKNLTNYKRPKVVEFRDDLPKTNVGKILRRALRDKPTE
ncbi:MAG: AMP-binding protein [Pseudomonadota bacterium]